MDFFFLQICWISHNQLVIKRQFQTELKVQMTKKYSPQHMKNLTILSKNKK
jgi:hypothetical protein